MKSLIIFVGTDATTRYYNYYFTRFKDLNRFDLPPGFVKLAGKGVWSHDTMENLFDENVGRFANVQFFDRGFKLWTRFGLIPF